MLATRLRELDDERNTMVNDLAREALRHEEPETIEVSNQQVIVQKPRFKGTHDIVETKQGWTVEEDGEYTTQIEDVDLTFSVHSLDNATLREIETALRDAGFSNVVQQAGSPQGTTLIEQATTDASTDSTTDSEAAETKPPEPQVASGGSLLTKLKRLFRR